MFFVLSIHGLPPQWSKVSLFLRGQCSALIRYHWICGCKKHGPCLKRRDFFRQKKGKWWPIMLCLVGSNYFENVRKNACFLWAQPMEHHQFFWWKKPTKAQSHVHWHRHGFVVEHADGHYGWPAITPHKKKGWAIYERWEANLEQNLTTDQWVVFLIINLNCHDWGNLVRHRGSCHETWLF